MNRKIYKNKDGKFHRVNGPAIEGEVVFLWFFNGHMHRYYGPALGKPDTFEYYILNEKIE